VEKVYYPGFAEHKGYEVQGKQADGAGGMISFVLKESFDLNGFFKALKIVTLAESLGGVESLISHPASMTHASIPFEIRQKVGIVDNLVRLSVGIENRQDLADDIDNALREAKR
jgi:cystathionine beta-lyase